MDIPEEKTIIVPPGDTQNQPVSVDPNSPSPSSANTHVESSSSHKPKAYTYKRYMVFLLIMMVGVAGLAAVIFTAHRSFDIRGKAASGGVTVALSPATTTADVGKTIIVGLTMNTNSASVTAAELHLTYNPTAIRILSFTPGKPLPVILSPETHDNGTISVALGVQPTSPFHGANILGTWTIKILKATQSSILFADTSAVAAIGYNSNILSTKTGSIITGIVPAPTPSPSASIPPPP